MLCLEEKYFRNFPKKCNMLHFLCIFATCLNVKYWHIRISFGTLCLRSTKAQNKKCIVLFDMLKTQPCVSKMFTEQYELGRSVKLNLAV